MDSLKQISKNTGYSLKYLESMYKSIGDMEELINLIHTSWLVGITEEELIAVFERFRNEYEEVK